MGCRHGIEGACTRCDEAELLASKDAQIAELTARVQANERLERLTAMLLDAMGPRTSETIEGAVHPMTNDRAAYFMRRFLREEKMLGPNEQLALHHVIAMLERQEAQAGDGSACSEHALATLRDYVERSTHWRDGGATRHDALLALGVLGADVPAPYKPKAAPAVAQSEPAAYADKIAFEDAVRAGKGCDVWPQAGDYESRTGRALVALYTRPAAPAPAPAPAPPPQAAYTYTSTQATTCAGCGKHKHTPLRIDAMGGYVCLTCIDKRLSGLLGEFGYQGVTMLTGSQIVGVARDFYLWTDKKAFESPIDFAIAVITKFCEVNGIAVPSDPEKGGA